MSVQNLFDEGLRDVEEGTTAPDSFEVRRMLRWLHCQLIVRPLTEPIFESLNSAFEHVIGPVQNSPWATSGYARHDGMIVPITMHVGDFIDTPRPRLTFYEYLTTPWTDKALEKQHGKTMVETMRENADG